ncbi:MAG: hypothetical protein NT056_08980 [Proteobacteria bacterium]|nr:hypothetical protein [Pseudomonadota bacterium]
MVQNPAGNPKRIFIGYIVSKSGDISDGEGDALEPVRERAGAAY